MGSLTLIRHNAHRVDVDGLAMLMHAPTTSLFEMDEVSASVYDLFRRVGVADADLLRAELGDRFSPQDLADCLQSLISLDILRDSADPGARSASRRSRIFPCPRSS